MDNARGHQQLVAQLAAGRAVPGADEGGAGIGGVDAALAAPAAKGRTLGDEASADAEIEFVARIQLVDLHCTIPHDLS